MPTYLVTGGAGFIGSHLVKELVGRAEKVKVLDNFVTGKRENLEGFLEEIELIEGDIRDLDLVRSSINGVDFILHEAALHSVPKSIDDPISTNEVNVAGTLNILIAARDKKVKRVVFASSSSIYGEREDLPEREEDKPQPFSPYAASKLAGEYYCSIFSRTFGLETVSLRYFNVFGPKQDPASEYAAVIPKFITCMLRNESPPVHGDGLQSRDFTYIDNVVTATLLATTAKGVSGEVFNIACGKGYTVLNIVSHLNKLLGKSIEPRFTPPRKGDVRHTLADISKVENLLGLKTNVDFEEGLKRTMESFKNEMIKREI